MIIALEDELISSDLALQSYRNALEPKKLVLIDASNHRFSDRRPELRAAYFSGLEWIRSMCRLAR